LKTFFNLLASSGMSTVHVIAHSMGNRLLAAALQDRTSPTDADRPGRRRFSELALLAPDIDAELFKAAIKQIEASAARVTLYASSRDAALGIAHQVAGYPRAGQAGPGILVLPGMQTIDASDVETDILGLRHSYFADNQTVLSDLYNLIRGRAPEDRFGLVSADSPAGKYWRFRPAAR
jgi:esterase/lipase superfamily enzyme